MGISESVIVKIERSRWEPEGGHTLGKQSVDSGSSITSHRSRLFFASCIALIATAMTFAIRGDTIGALSSGFNLTKEQVGFIMAGAYWGFTISIFIGGQLCDWLGMGKILLFAFLAHITGTFVIIFASGFWMLAGGTLVIGLANGFVEAAINPLVATVYSDQKTKKLNALHAWFPGGIVIGTLVCIGLTHIQLGWQIKFATVLAPTVLYGLLFVGMKFPSTERVQSGVSTGAMYKEALKPLFIVWFCTMLLTASTELGTNQWIGEIMSKVAGTGIIVLAWINIIMCIGRLFAGQWVHRMSPIKLLLGSSIFAAIGLFWLSNVHTPMTAYAASFVFAVGVCYFWPTMLGVTSERFPKGGALLLGLMGAAGMASAGAAQPIMGRLYDLHGPAGALRSVIILPVVLVVIFSLVFLRDRAKGGYKVESISGDTASKTASEKVKV